MIGKISSMILINPSSFLKLLDYGDQVIIILLLYTELKPLSLFSLLQHSFISFNISLFFFESFLMAAEILVISTNFSMKNKIDSRASSKLFHLFHLPLPYTSLFFTASSSLIDIINISAKISSYNIQIFPVFISSKTAKNLTTVFGFLDFLSSNSKKMFFSYYIVFFFERDTSSSSIFLNLSSSGNTAPTRRAAAYPWNIYLTTFAKGL